MGIDITFYKISNKDDDDSKGIHLDSYLEEVFGHLSYSEECEEYDYEELQKKFNYKDEDIINYDCNGEENGRSYFTAELVDGRSLKIFVDEYPTKKVVSKFISAVEVGWYGISYCKQKDTEKNKITIGFPDRNSLEGQDCFTKKDISKFFEYVENSYGKETLNGLKKISEKNDYDFVMVSF